MIREYTAKVKNDSIKLNILASNLCSAPVFFHDRRVKLLYPYSIQISKSKLSSKCRQNQESKIKMQQGVEGSHGTQNKHGWVDVLSTWITLLRRGNFLSDGFTSA